MNHSTSPLKQSKKIQKNKKGEKNRISAQDKTRTCTAFRPLPPQSSVYTNFTTWAKIQDFSGFL